MPFTLRSYWRRPVCSALTCHAKLSEGVGTTRSLPLSGWPPIIFIICIITLSGCSSDSIFQTTPTHTSISPEECLTTPNIDSCFYSKALAPKENSRLIIFVHGVFSTSTNTWGDAKTGEAWPQLVRGDDKFQGYDIYLVNYRTTYFESAPNIYGIAKRELERMKDKGIFKEYKEIYFVAHSMGGLVTKTLLKQLNRRDDEPLLRQVRGVVFLGTPSQGAKTATPGKWFSNNPQVSAMEPAHLNQWISELEDDWKHLMDERKESKYPRAFCAFETRPYLLGYIVVPREAAFSTCDEFTGLDLDHSGLTIPTGREADPYNWVMAKIDETHSGIATAQGESINLSDVKVLFECDFKPFIKMIPPEGGPKVAMFFPKSFSAGTSAYVQELGIPGQANLFYDPEKKGGRGHVCLITNYETFPLLNIELDFELRFKEPIYNPGHPVTGGTLKSAIPWTAIIEKVEPNEKFVFYLINGSEYFLEADTPDWIYFQRLGEFQTRTARLPTIRGHARLMFGPPKYPALPKMSR